MPPNLWNDAEYRALPDLDGLVYRSNLLGRDRAVCNIYGGNTSVKLVEPDHLGRPTRVLYVKASGSDVATIVAKQFASLKLDEIDPLFSRESMTDEEMTAYLSHTLFEIDRPRQSIETLLHAFVPHKHIDHTHPDAIISLACTPYGEATARKVFGDRMVWVDYIKPGFTLSKWIGQKVCDNPSAECVVMGKHGLVTWGDDPKTTYDHTIQIIQEAEDYIRDQQKGKAVFGAIKVQAMPEAERHDIAANVLPLIRGLVSKDRSMILSYDDSDTVLDYVGRERTGTVSQQGAACPDHLVHVKRQPLFVDWTPADGMTTLCEKLTAGVEAYRQRYVDYFNENHVSGDELRDPSPRVILIPGLGMINTGADALNADVSRQLYHRAISVIGGSEAVGGFESLSAAEAYAIEYWPLELYKLKLKPPDRDLAGKVAFITGAANGIGRATAIRMAQEGAHVVIADINMPSAEAVAQEITKKFGFKRGLAVRCDVTSEQAVADAFRSAVLAYGGVDIVVNNAGVVTTNLIENTTLAEWQKNMDVLATGYFLVSREAFRVFKSQHKGGSLIFVGSKNSLSPSKGVSAYNAAKAAELHLARTLAEEGGPFGIRVNSVLPDAVLQGSGMWSSEWREARAQDYGIKPEDMDEFYRKRSTLKVNVYPEDIAEAILFLAGPRSAKTTGGVLTVDGGVPTAYVR